MFKKNIQNRIQTLDKQHSDYFENDLVQQNPRAPSAILHSCQV